MLMLSNAMKTKVIKRTQDRELEAVGHYYGNGRPKWKLYMVVKDRIILGTINV